MHWSSCEHGARTEIKIIIIIIIIFPHQLGLDRSISAWSNGLFKGLPNHLRPFAVHFSTIFAILLLFILVTCRNQFDLCLLSLSSTGSIFNCSQNFFICFIIKKVYRLLFWKMSLFVLLSKKVYRLLFWKSLHLFYYQKMCTGCYSEKFLHLLYYQKKCTGCYSEKFLHLLYYQKKVYRLLFWKMSSFVLLSKKVSRLLFWKFSSFVLL